MGRTTGSRPLRHSVRGRREREGGERWTCAGEKLAAIDANPGDENGTTSLMGDARVVQLLLERHAGVTLADSQGRTALAKEGGRDDVVERLTDAGATR